MIFSSVDFQWASSKAEIVHQSVTVKFNINLPLASVKYYVSFYMGYGNMPPLFSHCLAVHIQYRLI